MTESMYGAFLQAIASMQCKCGVTLRPSIFDNITVILFTAHYRVATSKQSRVHSSPSTHDRSSQLNRLATKHERGSRL